MRIIEINATNLGSTGNIMIMLADTIKKRGGEAYICYPSSRGNDKKKMPHISTGNKYQRAIHTRLGYITGFNDCFSFFSTFILCVKIWIKHPDLIQLHNLHNCYLNLWLFFSFLKKLHIPVVWTLHDCWAFTGRCPHFTILQCPKWKTCCEECPYPNWQYPAANKDRTYTLWKLKKRLFCGLENVTVVTPSNWLANLTKESFLGKYPVETIYNGIDLRIFKPTASEFRNKIGSPCHIVLGVALVWGYRKGLDVFAKLAESLNEEYKIVLVGVEKELQKTLPTNIICLERTQNQQELAEIYTAADVFVNPTREEVLGLTNLEALACGTPVISFNTGGSVECYDQSCGITIYNEDIESLTSAICNVCTVKSYRPEDCVKFASQFDRDLKYQEYYHLYQKILQLKHTENDIARKCI